MNTRIQRTGLILLLAAFAVMSVRAGDPADVRDVVKKTFKVRPGGTVYLDLGFGDIDVVSRRGSEVLVEVETIVDADDRAEAKRIMEDFALMFQQKSEDVYVNAKYGRSNRGPWGRWHGGPRIKVHIRVEIPDRYNVQFVNGAGNVSVHRVDGTVSGRTGAGNIDVSEVKAWVRLQSGTGEINVNRVGGRVEANSGAGNIDLTEVGGEVIARTGAGNVNVTIVDQPRANSEITTGAGNVTVAIGRKVGVQVDASSAMGSANTDFPLRVEGKWMKKSFNGRVNGGGPVLILRAGVGNVELRKI